MDLQRQMLEQLMQPLIPQPKRSFDDPQICQNFLVAFCPSEVFQNTKVDLGRCPLIHDQKLQKEYHQKHMTMYDDKFYALLERMMQDVERNCKRNYQRLDHKSSGVYENMNTIKEQTWEFEERIQPEIDTVMELINEGKIGESFDFYKQVLKLHDRLKEVKQSDPNSPTFRPDQRLEICDICGTLLANDATGVRLEAHLAGF